MGLDINNNQIKLKLYKNQIKSKINSDRDRPINTNYYKISSTLIFKFYRKLWYNVKIFLKKVYKVF